jgi:cytosine/adenosine deaminase-related metal-dependent hydrolase
MRYRKHEITGTDVAGTQSKLDRIRPARTADGVSNTDEIGKGGFEGLDLFTQNIAAALQNARYGTVNGGPMR